MPINFTTDVEQICDQLSLYTNLQNFLGGSGTRGVAGINLEPGLTICNNTQQFLYSTSKDWKHNRKELSIQPNNPAGNFFVTQYGIQDILHAGATAFIPFNSNNPANPPNLPYGGVGIDLAASPVGGGTAGIVEATGTVTVQTLQQHPFQVGQTFYMSGNTNSVYNSDFTYNGNTSTSNWTNGWTILSVPDGFHFTFATAAGQSGLNSGAPGITDWSRAESAYAVDFSNLAFPQPLAKLDAVDRLAPSYSPNGDGDATPQVCMLLDMNNGVLKFRLSEPCGTYPMAVCMVYQGRPAKLTGPNSVIFWPDNWSQIIHEVALWQAFRFAKGVSAPETQLQFKIAQQMIQTAMAADDVESSGAALAPSRGIMAW
jgi:hypothetical protein